MFLWIFVVETVIVRKRFTHCRVEYIRAQSRLVGIFKKILSFKWSIAIMGDLYEQSTSRLARGN